MTKPPTNPAAQYTCGPHLRRTGRRVAAFVIVNGEAMCQGCFRGKAILDAVEETGVFRGRFKPRLHFVSNLRLRRPKPVSA
jgi:hypothetical protein